MTTEPAQDVLERTRAAHARCIACGRRGKCGLGLRFEPVEDGAVEALFECPEALEGYAGVLHGGVISTLLDAAMTNALFAEGVTAVTAQLEVRFRHPVASGSPAVVRAEVARRNPPLHVVKSRVHQDGQLKAEATGKFMEVTRAGCAESATAETDGTR